VQNNKLNRTYYVVLNGRKPGIYRHLKQALAQVDKFPNSRMKKIKGLQAAKSYFAANKQSVAAQKVYYVVKKGRRPGLYLNKEQAIQQIKGFPYGEMKRIIGYDQAKAYFDGKKEESKEQIPYIFIDGSYIQDGGKAGYGFVVVINDEIVVKNGGTIFDYEIINLHSLGAEMYAFIRALEWALINGYRTVRIIYDSKDIMQMIERDFSTSHKQPTGKSKLYVAFERYKQYITLEHMHVNHHQSFRNYRELADEISRLTSSMYE